MSGVIVQMASGIVMGKRKSKRKLNLKLNIIVSPSGMPPIKARIIEIGKRIIFGKEYKLFMLGKLFSEV